MIRQAVLLVGGRGTRVWPLTHSMPKGLLPVAGQSHGVPFELEQVLYNLGILALIIHEEDGFFL